MDINEKITALIAATGYTHAAVSKKAGVSTRQITRIVNKTSKPSTDTIASICEVLGVAPSVVVTDDPSMLDVVLILMSALDQRDLEFASKFIDSLATNKTEGQDA